MYYDYDYGSSGGATTDTDTEGETDLDEGRDYENFEEYAPQKESVIIFLDVDSFDVQVRGRNEGIEPEILQNEPFVVVNDHDVITAVNYPAKALGIRRTKECTLLVAKQMCHNLQVLTIPDHYGKPDALETRKASDEIYNSLKASLANFCERHPFPKIEKSSKDEFYIDVTEEVFHRVNRKLLQVPTSKEVFALKNKRCFLEAPGYRASGEKLSFRTLQVLTNKAIIQERHVTEALLMHGAVIANAILQDIRRDTSFVLSAGISSNKLLAKLGCGHNKPDAITILPQTSLGRVSKKIGIEALPGLGGKLGEALVQKLGIDTMSQLGHMHRVYLQKRLGGEKALTLHQLAIGNDPTTVVAKKFCNKLTCGITFSYRARRMSKPNHFKENLRNRFLEMRDHLVYEYGQNGAERIPKSLKLEIKTRKGNLKSAFSGTEELGETLKRCIESEGTAYRNGAYVTGGLPLAWCRLHLVFFERIKKECKIEVINDENLKAACTAIRKVSAINLIANFLPASGDED